MTDRKASTSRSWTSETIAREVVKIRMAQMTICHAKKYDLSSAVSVIRCDGWHIRDVSSQRNVSRVDALTPDYVYAGAPIFVNIKTIDLNVWRYRARQGGK